jgi:hypothetical protein
MKRPNVMNQDTDLFFFRQGEVPMWEENPLGGIWITKLKRNENINLMWEQLLLALTGEHFNHNESSVIGASLLTRGTKREQMIQVWMKDASDN